MPFSRCTSLGGYRRKIPTAHNGTAGIYGIDCFFTYRLAKIPLPDSSKIRSEVKSSNAPMEDNVAN